MKHSCQVKGNKPEIKIKLLAPTQGPVKNKLGSFRPEMALSCACALVSEGIRYLSRT